MTEVHHIHDIIIVGAGPCGLALAARLKESTPSALFTDSEHKKYHWMRSTSVSRRNSKPLKSSRRSFTAPDRLLSGPPPPEDGLDMVVLDAGSNVWMNAWDKKFESLNISHLRSPMFFHPDPRDRDGLLGFAYKDGEPENGSLRVINGVVGTGLSKYQRKKKLKTGGRSQETTYLDERDRHDYFRPSQKLFKSFCEDIATRYNLADIVEKSEVASIFIDSEDIFTLQTSTGPKQARMVVLATGPSSKPSIPTNSPFLSYPEGSLSHAFHPNSVTPYHLKQKIQNGKPTTIAVIGGGLTSAQITALAISSGVTKVYHFTRGPLKCKHFDVDLGWVAKFKNFHLAAFWGADSDQERFEMIQEARNGGSVNPEYKGILYDLVKKGKVQICEYTCVVGAVWDDDKETWKLETEPEIEGLGDVDHVVYATGVTADVGRVDMLQPLMRERGIDVVGGLPCLTDDLMWNDRTPLFMTGRLAGLRLGPGAGNLEGARQGAERIAWKVGELMREKSIRDDRSLRKGSRDSGYLSAGGVEEDFDMRGIGLGQQNQFSVLEVSDED